MTKSYDCIVCNKRATAPHHRLFKGWNMIHIGEICLCCWVGMSQKMIAFVEDVINVILVKNILNRNLTAENFFSSVDFSWTKSRRYCAICGMKRKIFKWIPHAARTYVFVTHGVMFYNNARACPWHFVFKYTFKNSEIILIKC